MSVIFSIALSLSACSFNPEPLDNTETRFHVAVVDRFYPGDQYFATDEDRVMQNRLNGYVDLDRDRAREPLYHGDIVSLLAAHKEINILPYKMALDQHPQREIVNRLKDIRKHVFWGEPIHALVLSWESSTLISAFEKPLRSENVTKYKEELRKWAEDYESWQLSYETIRLLEELVEAGVKVFTIAGNGGRGMVNTYSFADGVTTVGATELELRHFIADNALVDMHAQAAYQPRLVSDAEGNPKGYDFDGDSCPEVPLVCLSGYKPDRLEYPSQPWPMLKGSSFAAPVAMKRALLGEDSFPQECAMADASGSS